MRQIILALLLSFSLMGSSFAQDKEEQLTSDNWPTTVEATVKDLLSKIPEEDKETIRKTKKDDLIMFHHGWGTGIRNHYGLWRGNHALVKDACGEGCHPDDASMVIIEAVWKALQKECEFSHQVQHSGNEL